MSGINQVAMINHADTVHIHIRTHARTHVHTHTHTHTHACMMVCVYRHIHTQLVARLHSVVVAVRQKFYEKSSSSSKGVESSTLPFTLGLVTFHQQLCLFEPSGKHSPFF